MLVFNVITFCDCRMAGLAVIQLMRKFAARKLWRASNLGYAVRQRGSGPAPRIGTVAQGRLYASTRSPRPSVRKADLDAVGEAGCKNSHPVVHVQLSLRRARGTEAGRATLVDRRSP